MEVHSVTDQYTLISKEQLILELRYILNLRNKKIKSKTEIKIKQTEILNEEGYKVDLGN